MSYLLNVIAAMGVIAVPAIRAQTCNLSEYKASPGLMAEAAQKTLTITWDGEKNDEIRLRLSLQNGTPEIQDVAGTRQGPGSRWPASSSPSSMSFPDCVE
jgi:hypothetical protein